jgi:hypothetical protein
MKKSALFFSWTKLHKPAMVYHYLFINIKVPAPKICGINYRSYISPTPSHHHPTRSTTHTPKIFRNNPASQKRVKIEWKLIKILWSTTPPSYGEGGQRAREKIRNVIVHTESTPDNKWYDDWTHRLRYMPD